MNSRKNNLLETLANEFFDLRKYFSLFKAYTYAPHSGNDTKSTAEIASILNLDQNTGTERYNEIFFLPTDERKNFLGQIIFFCIGKNPPDLGHPSNLFGHSLDIAAGDDQSRSWIRTGNLSYEISHIAVRAAGKSTGIDYDHVTLRKVFFVV
jgi:hypothetical protein